MDKQSWSTHFHSAQLICHRPVAVFQIHCQQGSWKLSSAG